MKTMNANLEKYQNYADKKYVIVNNGRHGKAWEYSIQLNLRM